MTNPLLIVPGNTVAIAIIGDLFERAFDEPYGAAAVTDLTKSPATWSLVGFKKQEDETTIPVGFVIGMTAADTAEIYSIGVPPELRGYGYARSLLSRTLRDCAKAGANAVFLEVAADNESAIGLYNNAGFQPNGRRKNYYRRGEDRIDAIIMTRNL